MSMETASYVTEPRDFSSACSPAVVVTRGSVVESRHYAHIAVVDGEGRLVAFFGDARRVTFLRSAAKPFQAIPLLTTGAADKFGLGPAELAIACGSHHGTPEHVHTVKGMLAKLGLTRSALRCGVHPPVSAEAQRELLLHGGAPTQLHNNCSGKHAGMLAVALRLGASLDDYDWPAHPVQREIQGVLQSFMEVEMRSAAIATDGCGAPIYALPLQQIALGYARLGQPALSSEFNSAAEKVFAAMTACPEMVSCSGCLDTEIMRLSNGQIVSKSGAESVYCAAIRPNARWSSGLGIAIKIEDGGNDRARGPVALKVLEQLDALSPGAIAALRALAPQILRNHRGDIVGRLEAVFELEF